MSCKLKFVKTVIDRNGKAWNLYLDKADVEFLEKMRKQRQESFGKVAIDGEIIEMYDIWKEKEGKNANSQRCMS